MLVTVGFPTLLLKNRKCVYIYGFRIDRFFSDICDFFPSYLSFFFLCSFSSLSHSNDVSRYCTAVSNVFGRCTRKRSPKRRVAFTGRKGSLVRQRKSRTLLEPVLEVTPKVIRVSFLGKLLMGLLTFAKDSFA